MKHRLFILSMLETLFLAGCSTDDSSSGSKTAPVIPEPPAPEVSISVSADAYSIKENEKTIIKASVENSSEKVTWTVNDDTVISLSASEGLQVTAIALKTGTAVITATVEDKSDSITIQVTKNEIIRNISSYAASLMTPKNENQFYKPAWYTNCSAPESFKNRWNYIDGVILNSFVEMGETAFVKKYTDYYLNSSGKFVQPKGGATFTLPQELDSICESRILFDLAQAYPEDSRYTKAIEETYETLTNMTKTYAPGDTGGNPTGVNLSHKNSNYAYQVWLDGTYMYMPFLCRYALYKNELSHFDTIAAQFKYIHDHMKDSKTGLLYHGHDTQINAGLAPVSWANKTTGNSSSFWLRSMGWYVVALTDVIGYFPESHPERTKLISYLEEALTALMNFQNEEKLFFQVIDGGAKTYSVAQKYLTTTGNKDVTVTDGYAQIANYSETSGSSQIAYACLKASRLGYVDQSFHHKGKEIFEALYNLKYNPATKELKDICQQAGLNAANTKDGSPESYMAEKVVINEAKGVGPFLMVFLEYKK